MLTLELQGQRTAGEKDPDIVLLQDLDDGDVMQKQVGQLEAVLTGLSKENHPFVAGGDFDLLPPGQRTRLPAAEARVYRQDTEMALLYTKYQQRDTLEISDHLPLVVALRLERSSRVDPRRRAGSSRCDQK